MTVEDYAVSQELGNVVLNLLTNLNFLKWLKTSQNIDIIINENNKKTILFQVLNEPLLWATIVHDYGLLNNCKSELDEMLTPSYNLKHFSVCPVIELSSNFFIELCCPTTKK
jgi:hypothetical protein